MEWSFRRGPKRHVIWGFTRCKESPIELRETCPNGVNIFTTEVLPESTPKFPGKDVYYAWKATMPPAEESHAPCQLTVKQYGHIQTVKVFSVTSGFAMASPTWSNRLSRIMRVSMNQAPSHIQPSRVGTVKSNPIRTSSSSRLLNMEK